MLFFYENKTRNGFYILPVAFFAFFLIYVFIYLSHGAMQNVSPVAVAKFKHLNFSVVIIFLYNFQSETICDKFYRDGT